MMMLAVSDSGNEVSGGYQLTFQHFSCQRTGLHKKKLQGKKMLKVLKVESTVKKLPRICKRKVSIYFT